MDEDWDNEAPSSNTATVIAPAVTKNFDENNNFDSDVKTGFRNFDKNNNDVNSDGPKFGFGRRQNNDGGFNGGFKNRTNNDDNFGDKKGGFGGGGGYRRNNNFGDNNGSGFRKNNNDEEGGERKFGGFNGGNGGGFRPRQNNDENSERKGGFGGNGGGFRNRQNNDEGGERRSSGFGGGGFKQNRDASNDNGERKGGFGFHKQNDEDGGERKSFGFRQNRDDTNGENKGFGFRKNNNDQEGGERKFGGFNGGFRNRQNNDEGGERRSSGFGSENGFRGNNNNNNNNENGERKSGGFGFRPRQNNDEGGERRSGGFGGGFRQNRDASNDNGERKEGFGFRKQNDEEGGERKFGGGGGFRNRQNNDENSERRGGFRGNNNNDENSERKSGGFGGGGFRQNRDASNDNGERKGGFGNGFHKNNDNDNNNGFKSRRNGSNERGESRSGYGDRKPTNEGNGEEKKERYIPPPINDDDEDALFHTIPTGINFKKQAEIPVSLSGDDNDTSSIKPIESFDEPGFSELLLANIKRSNYEIPTPVQKYSIPIILQKHDLMACAQTGSGKTAAYLLPILTNILKDGIQSGEFSPVQTPQALILAPTRELAIQILTECKKFSFKSVIKSNILYGGTVTMHQLSDLSKGTNILVATPGRLLDVINKGKISLEKVKYIVLDEADRMLDLGFEGPVREILSKCSLSKDEKSTFMFSATFPKEIQKLAQDFLKKYLFLTIGIVGGANTDVEQIVFKTTQFEKRNKLLEILNDIGNERIMVFVEHKKQADILAFFLCQKNYPATSIHGDRLQSQREKALKDFSYGDAKIIVCTSVAARGLDIKDVSHVVNYDLPQTVDEYVHRIGRTGRCGNIGKAVSFFDVESENDRKIARNLIRILTEAHKEVPDWLNEIAEDAVGSNFTGMNKHTNDIRDNFKSLAITTTTATNLPNASATNDEEW